MIALGSKLAEEAQVRAAAVREARDRGEKLREIGETLGVSRQRIYQILNPGKRRAQLAVANRLRSGKITRPEACESCGVGCKPDAHHDDYSKPLAIRWLCKTCHGKAFTRLPDPPMPLTVEPPAVTAGDHIRQARVNLGMRQSELAGRIGMSSVRLSRIERGEVSMGIRVSEMKKLHEFLGVPFTLWFPKLAQPADAVDPAVWGITAGGGA